jgi:hypothetical protein
MLADWLLGLLGQLMNFNTIRSTDEFQQSDELFKSKLNWTLDQVFFSKKSQIYTPIFSRFKKQQMQNTIWNYLNQALKNKWLKSKKSFNTST